MVANRQANVKRWFMEMPAFHAHAVLSAAALNFHTLSRMLGQLMLVPYRFPGCRAAGSHLSYAGPGAHRVTVSTRAANTLNRCLPERSHCLAHSGTRS